MKKLIGIFVILLAFTTCGDPVVIIHEKIVINNNNSQNQDSSDNPFKFINNTTVVTKTYGDSEFTIPIVPEYKSPGGVTYTSSNPAIATVDPDTGEVTIKGAGTVTITATNDDGKKATYTLNINKAELTVLAGDITLTHVNYIDLYDDYVYDENINYERKAFTIEGFVYADTIAVVSGTPNITSTYNSADFDVLPTEPHSFPIVITRGSLFAANYDFVTFVNGILGVELKTQATLIITAVTAKTYGDANFNLSTGTTGSGSGAVTYIRTSGSDVVDITSTGTVTIKKVGTATVYAHKKGDNDYYSTDSAEITITVNPRNISLATAEIGGVYIYNGLVHEPIPVLTDMISGENRITASDWELDTPAYENNINVWTTANPFSPTVNIKATAGGNYTGTKQVTFNIYDMTITGPTYSSNHADPITGELRNAITPLYNGSSTYTTGVNERVATFSVVISGVTATLTSSIAHSFTNEDDIVINTSSNAATGFTIDNITSGYSFSSAARTFTYTVVVRLADNKAFPTGKSFVNINASGGVLGTTGITKPTPEFNIIDGQHVDRSLSVHMDNFSYFKWYCGNGSPGMTKHYKQKENFDLNLTTFAGNWTPIGNTGDSTRFTGTYDGQNFFIDNMKIVEAQWSGMFTQIGAGGVIKNVHLRNLNISSTRGNVGGIAGYRSSGTIEYCSVQGTIDSTGVIGGIVGSNSGPIRNCYVDVIITATGYPVGGIAGYNYSTIQECYFTGSVEGGINVGGIAGTSSGTISNCYSQADVIGRNNLGGISGDGSGKIYYSYSTGLITSIKPDVGSINSKDEWVFDGSANIGGIAGIGSPENSVALNPGITMIFDLAYVTETTKGIYTTIGRVGGGTSFVNNFARSNMKIIHNYGTPGNHTGQVDVPYPTTPNGPNTRHGEELVVGTTTFAEAFSGWNDTSIWLIPTGAINVDQPLPTLRTVPMTTGAKPVPTARTQNPTLPAALP